MAKNDYLVDKLNSELTTPLEQITLAYEEITLECAVGNLKTLLLELRDFAVFGFDQLIDLCGVDYLLYGTYDWETEPSTERGFSRGVQAQEETAYTLNKPRFAVVYHLLSTKRNHRVRVKVFLEESCLIIPSIHDLWKTANWFEREAYDLYGILFEGHPDLRRLLTDYGFIGHPFRKDFPLSGHVEMRYDAKFERVVYGPVEIEPRILVPKVIREDNRYIVKNEGE